MSPAIKLRRAARRRGSGMLIRFPATRCLTLLLHFVIAVHVGSDGAGARIRQEVALEQTLTQFNQTLFTEVTHAKEVFLIHRKNLADLGDVAALETVIGTHREVKFFNGRIVNLLGYGQAAQRRLLLLN